MIRRNLDSSFRPRFSELVSGGLSFGPLLAQATNLAEGSLSLWAPDDVKPIAPENLLTDIYFELPYDPNPDIARYLAARLNGHGPWLFLGETDDFESQQISPEVSRRYIWPVVESAVPAHDNYLCLGFIENKLTEEAWDGFVRTMKRYQLVAMIAKVSGDLAWKPGDFPELAGKQLEDLLKSAQFILVGIFDEMSMMLWERNPQPSDSSKLI